MIKFFKPILFAMAVAMAFTACSKDDKKIDVNSLKGEYVGTFDFVAEPNDLNADGAVENGVPIDVKVEGNKIILPEFPAATIVTALLGAENAAGLIPMLGQVTYEASINTGTVAVFDDKLYATLEAPEVNILVKNGDVVLMTVAVEIVSPDKVVYSDTDEQLIFTLKTTQISLDAGAGFGQPSPMVSTLKFTVVKK